MQSLQTSDGLIVHYDTSGFGVPHQAPDVTSYAVRKAIKEIISLVPSNTWDNYPASPGPAYENLIWTPWRIVNPHTTPGALSERIRMRSVPLWDSAQWDNYALCGPYLSQWDNVCASIASKLALLYRIFPTLRDMSLLEIGCGAGASLLNYAIHGADVYGLEIDPIMYANTSKVLRDKVIWSDALYAMYAWSRDFFDVVFVSCLGYIMSADYVKFFTDIWLSVKMGSPIILDLPRNAQEVSVTDKVSYGPYVRPSSSYRSVLTQSGFTYTDTVNGLLVATKTHTPTTL